MSTLVVCVDREGAIAEAGDAPVAGRERVASLVTTVGLDDPDAPARIGAFIGRNLPWWGRANQRAKEETE